MYAEVESKSYEIEYYVYLDGESKPIKCWDLPKKYNINEDMIDDVISKIATILRSNSPKQNKWSSYTLTFDSSLKFTEDYDYSDLSEGNYEHKKDWKKETYFIRINRRWIRI